METEIHQIKLLVTAVLALQVLFVVGNILCRVLGCGRSTKIDYGDLWQRGKIDAILSKTEARLASHPSDVDALYFRAKALMACGLPQSAPPVIERLAAIEPSLSPTCASWLAAMPQQPGGT